jgi:hypothetical protein
MAGADRQSQISITIGPGHRDERAICYFAFGFEAAPFGIRAVERSFNCWILSHCNRSVWKRSWKFSLIVDGDPDREQAMDFIAGVKQVLAKPVNASYKIVAQLYERGERQKPPCRYEVDEDWREVLGVADDDRERTGRLY